MEHEEDLGQIAPHMRSDGNGEEPGSGRGGVGGDLRAARDAAGLSRADIAARTKIAERHLGAIEEGRFCDLAAPTYAVGFARAYARTLGLDETDVARRVREELEADHARQAPKPPPSFEPGDPARVPSRSIAWLAIAAVVVVVVLMLVFWGNFLSPEGRLPDLISDKPATQSAPLRPAPAAAPSSAAIPAGPVVITATMPSVWIKVTDAQGKQLVQKVLSDGETWTVPDGASKPMLRVGRADGLKITYGGKVVPPLSDKSVVMGDVSLVPADLAARAAGQSAPPAAPASAQASLPQAHTPPAPAAQTAQGAGRAARPAPKRSERAAVRRSEAAPSPAPQPSPSAMEMVSRPVVQPISTTGN